MRLKSAWLSLGLPIVFCFTQASIAIAAEVPAASSPLTLTLMRAVGTEAVIARGKAANARTLEATVYATYSRDLPTVILSRRLITVDANGAFSATLPTAPAYFRDATVTVVVRSQDGLSRSARISVAAPNIDTPADIDPSR
jgi:hypothetical protein